MGLSKLDESFLWANKNCKRKKVKVACLVQFLGSNYSGFQILENLGTGTIEGCLQLALFKAGAIYHRNVEKLSKIGWKRVSRTDKGVHSSGSIISLKIQNPHDTFPKLAIEINKFLPTDIHLVCITQFQKNFNCYFACVDRTYNYILPTHSLISAPYNTNMITETTKALAKESIDFTAETPNNVNKHSNLPRVSIEQLHEMAKILSEFEGTHYFHNFTRSSKTEKDKNADYYQRFIKSMRLDDVFTFKGAEFVQIEIKGQSFIYNQIRKMIGFFISKFRALGKRDENFHQNCVEICQNSDENNEKSTEKDGNSTKNSKDNNNLAKNIKNLAENCEIFKKDNKVQIPCAPSLGLFLKETSFYDRKKRKVVDFGQKDEIYAFIEKRIIPEICENELSKNCFEEWLTENQENM